MSKDIPLDPTEVEESVDFTYLETQMTDQYETWLAEVEEQGRTVLDANMTSEYSVDDTGLNRLDIAITWREGEEVESEEVED